MRMTKVFVEICVLKPKETFRVVQKLIDNGCAAVIRADAYDQGGPTTFVYGYGEREGGDEGLREYFEQILAKTGGDLIEYGEGHEDTMEAVVPPIGQQFAIDVFNDKS